MPVVFMAGVEVVDGALVVLSRGGMGFISGQMPRKNGEEKIMIAVSAIVPITLAITFLLII